MSSVSYCYWDVLGVLAGMGHSDLPQHVVPDRLLQSFRPLQYVTNSACWCMEYMYIYMCICVCVCIRVSGVYCMSVCG